MVNSQLTIVFLDEPIPNSRVDESQVNSLAQSKKSDQAKPQSQFIEQNQGDNMNAYQYSNEEQQQQVQKQNSKEQEKEQEKDKLQPKQISKKDQIDNFMSGSAYEISMTVITIYILYADDIRILTTDKDGDPGFYVTVLICIFLFLFEIVILSIVRKDYIWGFFFWMDLISTLSTFMEIPWVMDDILGLGMLSGQTSMINQQLRAGRASRVSSRATKIIRIVRLIRIVRVSKLYKYAQQSIADKFTKLNKGNINLATEESIGDLDYRTDNKTIIDSPDNTKILQFKQPQSVNPTKQRFSIQPIQFIHQDKRKSGLLQLHSTDHSNQQYPNNKRYSLQIHQSSLYSRNNNQQEILAQDQQFNNNQQNMIPDIDEYSENSERVFVKRKQRLVSNTICIHDQKQVRQIDETQEDEMEINETQVGKRLSDITTKRAIFLMFSVMVSIPFFDYSTYWENTNSFQTSIELLTNNYNNNLFDIYEESFLSFHKDLRTPLLLLEINDKVYYEVNQLYQLRNEEEQMYQDEKDNVTTNIIISIQTDVELGAYLGLARTTFVIIIMVCGAIFFSKDTNDLVVIPIENMLSKIKRISNNPLDAAKMEEEVEILEQELMKGDDEKKKEKFLKENNDETKILEKLIVKTASLLAVGFGQAGGDIITKNLQKDGAVNPLIPGNKLVAIFGFCDIRNFTDVTEILQEKVMLFVNEIAQIVHTNVHDLHGSANKNIGDAFLLVWKFPPDVVKLIKNEEFEVSNLHIVNDFADLSLLAFVKIMISCKKCYSLDKISKDERVQRKLPNYQVRLGYGLHLGWAIEVSEENKRSQFKIDASYLSPNVNMAARLESGTKLYGTSLLLMSLCNSYADILIEQQQRVVSNRLVIMRDDYDFKDLLTFDVDLDAISVDKQQQVQENGKIQRYMKRKKLQQQMRKILLNKYRIINHFICDTDLQNARKKFTDEFVNAFDNGIENYLLGNWYVSKNLLNAALEIIPNDGPSNTLLNFMSQYKFKKPQNWKGYRELNEK